MFCSVDSCGISLEEANVRSHFKEVHSTREKGDEVKCLWPSCEKTFTTMASLMGHLRYRCKQRNSVPTTSNVEPENSLELLRTNVPISLSHSDGTSHVDNESASTFSSENRIEEFSRIMAKNVFEQQKSRATEKLINTNVNDFASLLDCAKKIVVSSMSKEDEKQCVQSTFSLLTREVQSYHSTRLREKMYNGNIFYVEPRKIVHGSSIVKEKNDSNVKLTHKDVSSSFVSIVSTLEALHQNSVWRHLCYGPPDHECVKGFYKGHCCGTAFQSGPFSKLPKNSLALQIYVDGFSPADGMKQNASKNSLGAVYFRILNLPMKYQSLTQNIHLATLYNERDFKKKSKFSLNSVLAPIVEDLQKLEAGVEINFSNEDGTVEEFTMRGTLFSEAYDNLARHKISGLVESFNTR